MFVRGETLEMWKTFTISFKKEEKKDEKNTEKKKT